MAAVPDMLGVPLLREGMPIGVIALARRTVRPFTEKQIELVTTFADQAVIAIENTRLFEEVQQRTHELTKRWSSRPPRRGAQGHQPSPFDLQPVLDTLEIAARLCEAEFGFYARRTARLLRRRQLLALREADATGCRASRSAAVGRSCDEHPGAHYWKRRTVHIPDVLADPEYRSELLRSWRNTDASWPCPLLRERTI